MANNGEQLPLATFRSQGSFATGDSLSGTISAGIAETIDNGLYVSEYGFPDSPNNI